MNYKHKKEQYDAPVMGVLAVNMRQVLAASASEVGNQSTTDFINEQIEWD